MSNTNHDCIQRLDEQLAAHNTRISTGINFSTGGLEIQVATSKLGSSKRGKPTNMYASFCPFCGIGLRGQSK